MKTSAILLLSCPDAKGEVATIADFVYRHGGNILHADEHADEESGLFLMRVEIDPKDVRPLPRRSPLPSPERRTRLRGRPCTSGMQNQTMMDAPLVTCGVGDFGL